MKTMSEKEINHMIRVLPNYFHHLDNNPQSLIAKIFGIFTIQMDQFEPIHVMIMENSLPNVENTEMHYVFDMKGSSINREVLKRVTNQ
jgi:1-phosphatidylinositol-4-phosphate 5-kinase